METTGSEVVEFIPIIKLNPLFNLAVQESEKLETENRSGCKNFETGKQGNHLIRIC